MRLSLAFDAGLPVPDSAILLHPNPDFDIAGLSPDIVQPFKPFHDAWARTEVSVSPDRPDGHWSLAVVVATRSKQQTYDLIAWAAAHADTVVVDGQKTDGIDSLFKAVRSKTDIGGTVTKAHGRLFWFAACDVSEWQAQDMKLNGYVTRPGVFSADGVDPASAALTDMLPAQMKGDVLDLGAGWGYLSKDVLDRDASSVTLVEADHIALDCAKSNIQDDRATFLWADATGHKGRYNWVVMNPPFHRGRKGDPVLGQDFIRAAARCLAPGGQLWMVANAHLPYEAAIEAVFAKVETFTPDRRFKIFHAMRPKR